MATHSPLTKDGLPIIKQSPPTHAKVFRFRELPRSLILANAVVAVVGVLSIPLAIGLTMGAGMTVASGNGFRNDPLGLLLFFVLCLATIGFPVVCAAAVACSLYLGSRGAGPQALAAAVIPPLACVVITAVFVVAGL
jgi:hypothetical protein